VWGIAELRARGGISPATEKEGAMAGVRGKVEAAEDEGGDDLRRAKH
jgi:hypothetical protein